MATKSTPTQHSVVVKANVLIPQLARLELSELRFLAFCLAHYDSRGQENKQLEARIHDLCDIFPMHESSAYRVVKQVIVSLGKKPVEFQIGKTLHLYHWFSGLRYETDTGVFTFCISPEMEPFIFGLNKNFTPYRLGSVYQFRSANTWKLYENVARWKAKGIWSVSLDKFRFNLGIEGKYPRWAEIQRRIINPSIKEINDLSDLQVTYEKEKCGRSVVGLVFYIDKRNLEDVTTLDDPREAIRRPLLTAGLNDTSAQDLLQMIERADKLDVFLKKIPKIIARHKNGSGPKAAYVRSAIIGDLKQMSLFDIPEQKVPDHKIALDCWQSKRQKGEECKVRQRGTAGNRKKCQICLDKISLDMFGV